MHGVCKESDMPEHTHTRSYEQALWSQSMEVELQVQNLVVLYLDKLIKLFVHFVSSEKYG